MKWDIAVKWLVKLCEKNKSDHWKLILNRSISKRKKERKKNKRKRKKETSGNFLGRFFKVSEKILETKSPFSQSWLAFHKRVVNYTWESNDLTTTPPQLSIYTWLNSNQSFLQKPSQWQLVYFRPTRLHSHCYPNIPTVIWEVLIHFTLMMLATTDKYHH